MSSSRLSDLDWTCVQQQLDAIRADQAKTTREHGREVVAVRGLARRPGMLDRPDAAGARWREALLRSTGNGGSVRPAEEGEARKRGRTFTVDDAAATRRCAGVAKTVPTLEDELSRALLGEEANYNGVMGGESATDVKEEDPVATATPPPVAETPTVPSPPTEAVAVADDFSAIVSPPHKLAVAIRSHALMTEKVVAHPQLTSTATPVVGDIAATPKLMPLLLKLFIGRPLPKGPPSHCPCASQNHNRRSFGES
ncbi:unnamed protein product [Linum trigynum]|uniref:Uncharacterized protein n=1 Tax=Linum trigynum TaxID=586398 RepID=A0AAV2GN90_9ROSI